MYVHMTTNKNSSQQETIPNSLCTTLTAQQKGRSIQTYFWGLNTRNHCVHTNTTIEDTILARSGQLIKSSITSLFSKPVHLQIVSGEP